MSLKEVMLYEENKERCPGCGNFGGHWKTCEVGIFREAAIKLKVYDELKQLTRKME